MFMEWKYLSFYRIRRLWTIFDGRGPLTVPSEWEIWNTSLVDILSVFIGLKSTVDRIHLQKQRSCSGSTLRLQKVYSMILH